MPLVDETAALTVETMLGSEPSSASIAVGWEVEKFEAISISDVIGELLLVERGALPG